MTASQQSRLVSTCCAVAGGIGAFACAVSMVLAALGIAGTAAAASGSMAGMSGVGNRPTGAGAGGSSNAALAFLLQAGPAILVISIALLTISLGIRRRTAAPIAVVVGALMFWGMYGQSRLAVMYLSLALGVVAWIALYLWTYRRTRFGFP